MSEHPLAHNRFPHCQIIIAKVVVPLIVLITSCRNGLSTDSKNLSFAEMMTDDVQVSREERCFRLWINSFGISSYINNLFEDVRNGYIYIFWYITLYLGLVVNVAMWVFYFSKLFRGFKLLKFTRLTLSVLRR